MNESYKIINNPDLTQEEKNALLKMLDNALEKDNEEDDSKIYEGLEKYNEKQKEIVIKARKRAEENKKRIARINYEAEIKEKSEILSYLKNKMGENQFSKKYLDTLSGNEIRKIYEDCERTMPEYIKKAKNDRAFHKSHKGVNIVSSDETEKVNNTKKENTSKKEIIEDKEEKKSDDKTISLDSIANRLNINKEDLVKDLEVNKPQKKMVKIKRLDADKFKSEEKDDLDGQTIAKEEDGSRFTKFKRFVSKHKKAILIGATLGVLGGIALYYAMKQGDASTVHDTITSMKGAGEVAKDTVVNNVPDDHTNVNHIVENVKDLAENVKDAAKANEGKVYNTAQNLAQQTNGVTPNDWFIYDNWDAYITSDGIVHEGNFTVDQLIEMKTNGVDIVGVRTGNPNLDYPYSGYATLNDIIAHSKDAIGGKVK